MIGWVDRDALCQAVSAPSQPRTPPRGSRKEQNEIGGAEKGPGTVGL